MRGGAWHAPVLPSVTPSAFRFLLQSSRTFVRRVQWLCGVCREFLKESVQTEEKKLYVAGTPGRCRARDRRNTSTWRRKVSYVTEGLHMRDKRKLPTWKTDISYVTGTSPTLLTVVTWLSNVLYVKELSYTSECIVSHTQTNKQTKRSRKMQKSEDGRYRKIEGIEMEVEQQQWHACWS